MVDRRKRPSAIVHSTRIGAFTEWEKDDIYAAIRRGVEQGHSDKQIARNVGIADRTVLRFRKRHGLPNFYGKETA